MRRFSLGPISSPAWVLGLLLPLAMVFSLPAASETLRQQADALRDREAPSIADVPLFSGRFLAEFYAERDYTHAWDAERAGALLTLAQSSRADGFDPEDFHAGAIAQVLDSAQLRADSEASRAAADILLSDALLRYVHHFRFGKYNPRMINSGQIFVAKADAELLKADLERVLAAPDLAAEVAALLPDAPFYRNLKLGYQRYLAIADRGGWSNIPAGANLSIGSKSPRVALIRQHLEVIDGYQPSAIVDPESFDEDLAAAVKGFQKRSGLSTDGVVGPATLRALNQPLDDRLLTIRANLERMRWLYNDLPADYLLVDITAFRLQLLRNHEEVWTTPVVIGTTDAQTPMFRDEMEHIVFNPTWSVPVSIQKKMRGVSSRYQVVDRRTGRKVSGVDTSNYKRYRIVQPAGPSNALGRVKFMFPNGHAIYLHDTPSRHLFSRSQRAYSHGCVRVKDPLTLAQQVLNKPNWDQSEINRVVQRGKTRYVHLDDHLPVLLYYLTAVADDQGRVGFRRDVYNRDKRLLDVLDKPAHVDRIAFLEPEPEPELEPATKPESAPESESVAVLPTEAAIAVVAERNGSLEAESNAEPAPSTAATAASVDVPISPLSVSIPPGLNLGAAGSSSSPSVVTNDVLPGESLEVVPALFQGLSGPSTAVSRSGDAGGTETVLLLPPETVDTGSGRQTPAPRLLSQ